MFVDRRVVLNLPKERERALELWVMKTEATPVILQSLELLGDGFHGHVPGAGDLGEALVQRDETEPKEEDVDEKKHHPGPRLSYVAL